jgi:hypothetical protein
MSQQEFEPQEEEDFILGRKYNVLEKFQSPEFQSDHGHVREMDGRGQWKVHSYESLPYSFLCDRFHYEVCAGEWFESTHCF